MKSLLRAENIPDKVLLAYMTDHEKATKDDSKRPPFHSASAVFWRYCPLAKRRQVMRRIQKDPALYGRFMADVVAFTVWGRIP